MDSVRFMIFHIEGHSIRQDMYLPRYISLAGNDIDLAFIRKKKGISKYGVFYVAVILQ